MVEEEAQPIVLPEVTADLKSAARALLLNVELNNGHLAIAHSVGLARSQVKEIHNELIIEQQVVIEE